VNRFLVLSFWGATTFAFVMAVLPHPPEVPGVQSDKVQHILAFVVLAGLGAAAYPKMGLARLGFALSCFGALIELVQAIPALHRDSDFTDWVADTIAASAVLVLAYFLRNSRKGNQLPP
jgi:VanZ family protein